MKIFDMPLDTISDLFPDISICNRINDYCRKLNDYIDNHNEIHNWTSIIDMISLFNSRYGVVMTNKQKSNFEALINSDTSIIVLPYQPNAFPSFSVISMFIVMEIVAEKMAVIYNKTVVPLYLIVDYDVSGDRRFQGSFYPSLDSPYSKSIKINLKKDKSNVMFNTSMPSLPFVYEKYKRMIDELSYIINMSGEIADLRKCNDLSEYINSISSVEKVSVFNVLIILYICSNILDTGVLFVEGHENYKVDGGLCISKLLETLKYHDEISFCFNEFRTKIQAVKSDVSFREENCCSLWGYSLNDNKRVYIKFDEYANDYSHVDYILPNVLYDYLMDYLFFSKVGGVGYIKQMEMTLLSDYIIKRVFGIKPVPQLLLNCNYCFNDLPNSTVHFFEWFCEKNSLSIQNYKAIIEDSHCCSIFYLLILNKETIINYIREKYK